MPAIGAAFNRAISEPATARPPSWSITTLWLQLLEQNEIAHAAWVREREAELYGPASADEAQNDRTALADELAAVAARLPTEILAALAHSIRAEMPEHAEQVMLEHWLRDMHSARLVRELLARDAPRLFKRYGLALRGRGKSVGPSPKLHHIGGVAFSYNYSRGQRIAFALGGAALVLVPVIFLSTGRKLGSAGSDEADGSTGPAQPPWLRELCLAHDQRLCASGARLYEAKACGEAFAALNDLKLAAMDLAQRDALDAHVEHIVVGLDEDVQVECRRVPGTPSWRPYSPD